MPWDPKKELLQLQVEKELKDALREQAKHERRSLSAHCVYLLEEGIARVEREIEEREREKGEPHNDEKAQ